MESTYAHPTGMRKEQYSGYDKNEHPLNLNKFSHDTLPCTQFEMTWLWFGTLWFGHWSLFYPYLNTHTHTHIVNKSSIYRVYAYGAIRNPGEEKMRKIEKFFLIFVLLSFCATVNRDSQSN